MFNLLIYKEAHLVIILHLCTFDIYTTVTAYKDFHYILCGFNLKIIFIPSQPKISIPNLLIKSLYVNYHMCVWANPGDVACNCSKLHHTFLLINSLASSAF